MRDRDLRAINDEQAMRLLEALGGPSFNRAGDQPPEAWGDPQIMGAPDQTSQPADERSYETIQKQALDAIAKLTELAGIDPQQDLQGCQDALQAALSTLAGLAESIDLDWPDEHAFNRGHTQEPTPHQPSPYPFLTEGDY